MFILNKPYNVKIDIVNRVHEQIKCEPSVRLVRDITINLNEGNVYEIKATIQKIHVEVCNNDLNKHITLNIIILFRR